MKYWKENLLMLEQRILAKFLSENFDQLQYFITPDGLYSPIIVDDSSSVKYQLKHLKILQEAKRNWLDIYQWTYILKIQEYDRHYQQELIQLKQCLNNSTGTAATLFQSVQTYMTHRENRLKEEIYLQMSYFHTKLTRRRQCSSIVKHMTGVSPEVILDVYHHHHDLNAIECEYLSRGMVIIKNNRVDIHKNSFLFIFVYI